MDITKTDDYFKKEFIYFLRHPEKADHYLIIQEVQGVFDDYYHQFHRTGKYEGKQYAIMPCNKVKFIDKVAVPDKNLFGLCYFITDECGVFIHEEDERYPYAELGWYVLTGDLQINKWLKDYIEMQEAKKKQQKLNQKPETIQTSLF